MINEDAEMADDDVFCDVGRTMTTQKTSSAG